MFGFHNFNVFFVLHIYLRLKVFRFVLHCRLVAGRVVRMKTTMD
jgi:hypothetical protein